MTDEPTKAKGETTHPDWTGAAAPGSAPGHAALPNALRIGRYTIVRVLGEGGMGTVYEAQQESPKRTVALKVIRAGYLSPELLRRFTQESQVLGRLQHPGIAQVYEAGMAKDERGHELPFFAMEFIKGVPLTEYVTQKKLGTRDRLELVAKVCDAVYHAHQKGVIHRDLKPGNIIVDESGQPKILDFGIARATDSDIQQTTLQTDIGQLIGTIPYMSPEQVSGDPNDLDTRSDVYALGVIAYEILAGRLPYDLQRKMIHEAARIIREEDPTRLSSINRTLRGDVETIVAKALEKDKLRRYQSAESFASDIRRYLKHEPITARPASTWYQAARFARRNRGLVAGLAAAFLLLVAGLVGTSYGLRQAVASRNAEALQRKTAEVQRDKAEKIAEFMSDTLKGAGPSVARGRDITMLKEMMDAAAARIENGDLKDAPEAELRLRATIGIAYRELAVYDAAQRMLEPAVSLARSTHAADDLTTAEAVANLGRLLQVRGDLARAEPLYRESLEMKKRLFPGDHPDVATGLNNLGDLLRARGDLAGAEPPLRKALEMYQRLFPGDHPNVAIGLGNLANLLQARGDLAGAEPLCRESLEMTKRLFSGDHPNVATGLNNLAGLLHARGDLAGAEPLFEQALQMQRRLFPGDSPEVATGLNNLALMYRARGDTAGAETLCRESLEMKRRLFQGDHPAVAASLSNLANILGDRGDLAGAEPLCRQSLEMYQHLFPGDHPSVATGLNNLAALLQQRGDLTGAEPLIREAMEMRKRVLGDEHPDTLLS
ncbi:MAG: serine/threonine protein kinase, partial [Phycisphaerae bacterium]|nr:serine/threonine protein kinase [Phycisphaerae bacterium]